MLPLFALVPALALNATVAFGDDGPTYAADTHPDELGRLGLILEEEQSGQTLLFSLALPDPSDPLTVDGVLGLVQGTKSGGGNPLAVKLDMQQEHHAPRSSPRTDAATGAAATAAVAAATSAVWWPWLRSVSAVMLAPLYSRLERGDLLDNDVRRKLYEAIQGQPGLAQKELAEIGGGGWGTTVYHLQRLEQAGMVRSQKVGHHRRFFATEDVDRRDQDALGLIQNDTTMKISRFVLDAPGCNQKDVCEALGISPSLAHKYLKRMEDAGMVTKEREWRTVKYTPSEKLGTLVEATA